MSTPKTVRVRVHELYGQPRDITIDCRSLSDDDDQMLAEIHSKHGGRKVLQDLTCGPLTTHPVWLVVVDWSRQSADTPYVLRHWPGSGLKGKHYVSRRARMSDEHKRQEEYVQRCASEHPGVQRRPRALRCPRHHLRRRHVRRRRARRHRGDPALHRA